MAVDGVPPIIAPHPFLSRELYSAYHWKRVGDVDDDRVKFEISSMLSREEQLRLESTMQSKIRVYESGRAEQYDPDMPPELAATGGIHNSSAENVDTSKVEGSARLRPPLMDKEKECQRSPLMSSGESTLDRRSWCHQREGSVDSMEGKHSPDS